MGRFDNHTWTKVEDFSYIRDLEFADHVLIELFNSLMKIYEAEGLDGRVKMKR